MKNGLSVSLIFKAQSLNYGEGIGNISELKKLTRGNGDVYTYTSRQALRYDITRLGAELYDWNLDVIRENGTLQFGNEYTIEDSQEMDLFGYMKTNRGNNSKVRSAVVRLSNAVSLEEYKEDIDFLNNKGFADRCNKNPNLANIEQHLSYYTYTITIDLDKIGKDDNDEIDLPKNEKTDRVNQLLNILKILNREIRGRIENLSPVFVIGGIYDINSPFFLGRIKLYEQNNGFSIDTEILKDTTKLTWNNASIYDDTNIGIVKNIFENEEEIEEMFQSKVTNIEEFFAQLEEKVNKFYGI